jgi:hypothetical protein
MSTLQEYRKKCHPTVQPQEDGPFIYERDRNAPPLSAPLVLCGRSMLDGGHIQCHQSYSFLIRATDLFISSTTMGMGAGPVDSRFQMLHNPKGHRKQRLNLLDEISQKLSRLLGIDRDRLIVSRGSYKCPFLGTTVSWEAIIVSQRHINSRKIILVADFQDESTDIYRITAPIGRFRNTASLLAELPDPTTMDYCRFVKVHPHSVEYRSSWGYPVFDNRDHRLRFLRVAQTYEEIPWARIRGETIRWQVRINGGSSVNHLGETPYYLTIA